MTETKEIFLRDVTQHKVSILKDEGKYRHIKFSKPLSSYCRFDLITYPNHLCISGDIGCYVFSRTNDMFNFFRRKDLTINPKYWMEKCQAICNNSKLTTTEIDKKGTISNLKEYLTEIGDLKDFEEIESIVNNSSNTEMLISQIDRIKEIDDLWDMVQYKIPFRAEYCLYAIVWGIQQYDKIKRPL